MNPTSDIGPKKQSGLIALAALLGVLLTLWLGEWQLSRGYDKDQMKAQFNKQMNLPALSQSEILSHREAWQFFNRRAELGGEWLTDLTIYLANRSHEGKSGFWVMTPLKLEDSTVVLVERGWVPWNPVDPSQIPDQVETPKGLIQIQGLISKSPSKMLELWGGSKEEGSETKTYLKSGIWQNFDLSTFENQTGLKVSAFIHQIAKPSEGLIRDLPVQGISSDKNYGYAVQWFLLSALIGFLYFWFQWIKPYLHAKQQ
jgi:surfeit locus 1 family protein